MKKEGSTAQGEAIPNTPELEFKRQFSNRVFEIQNPEALKSMLLMLRDQEAKLEIGKENEREYAKVKKSKNDEVIFMTKEPSEIALLKNPVAGIQFLEIIEFPHRDDN